MSLESIFFIGNGINILPFLNRPEFQHIAQVSHAIRKACLQNHTLVRFYDYSIPMRLHKKDHIFIDLFYRNYISFEQRLKNQEHIENMESPYIMIDLDGEMVPSMYRGTMYVNLWNKLCVMEIAYMLCDRHAIAILKKYKVTLAHEIRPHSSSYGSESRRLLQVYRRGDILYEMEHDSFFPLS